MIYYELSITNTAIKKGGDSITDNAKLDLILSKLEKLNALESDMQELKQRIASIESHIENVIDKDIQLLAENYVELTKRFREAIPTVNSNFAYEIKVNYLACDVEKLKAEVAELKSKIA